MTLRLKVGGCSSWSYVHEYASRPGRQRPNWNHSPAGLAGPRQLIRDQ
jgi:hypothetical protein